MKPLSEKELREKLLNHFTGGAPSYRAANESGQAAARSLAEPILEMWLQDRKAWGEYVIGGNIPFLQLNDGSSRKKQDVYASGQWHMMNRLLAAQRQRNQGEKD